jgi:hypothetical protein
VTTTGAGPPEREEPGATPDTGPNQQVSDDTTTVAHSTDMSAREPGKTLVLRGPRWPVWVPCTRSYPQDLPTQRQRRRHAAARSVPLDCGCRDPYVCHCTEPPLSEHAIESWRRTALHLLGAGHVPFLPLEARRALWKRGGADRVLAELLHDACGGEAA